MSRSCSVCQHAESFRINELLIVEKQSNRTIANQFGLHYSAIQRHREHIPDLLLRGSAAMEVFEADVILDRLQSLW